MVKSLSKALQVLKLFSDDKRELHINDIVAASGFHKSSIHRLLTTLEKEGFLERVAGNRGKYRLGIQMFLLGKISDPFHLLRSVARPCLEELVDITGETAHLCVEDQLQCLYIMRLDTPNIIRMVTRVGLRLPLHCTAVGKVLLSSMPEGQVDKLINERGMPPFTANTITVKEKLLSELAKIKRQGVAFDNEEREIGLRCIAAPLLNEHGETIAAISISGPSQRLTRKKLNVFSNHVRNAAHKISEKLGRHQNGSEPP